MPSRRASNFYYYEELGWAIIFAANTIASAYLYATVDTLGGREILIQLNLLFGIVYLPWQFIHVRALSSDARKGGETGVPGSGVTWKLLAKGLGQSIHVRNRTSDAEAWGRGHLLVHVARASAVALLSLEHES